MAILRQLILGVLVLGGTLWAWGNFVPSSVPYLERLGIADLLGVEAVAEEGGEGRRWGSRGPAAVVAAPVETGVIDDRIEAIGDGRALRAVTLRPEVTGRITALPLSGGQYVEEGTVVLELDRETQRIALERARLVFAEAQADAERLAQLGTTGAVTEVRLREARLALETAELALEEAEYNLDRRTVRAPISGWMGVIDVDVGDRVAADDVISTITDRSAIIVDFRVPERAVLRVTPGTEMTARPLGLTDKTLTGTIQAVDTVIDSTSRTMRVKGRVENADDLLRAGMAFEVTLRFPGESLPSVDPISVQWSADGSYVWAVREGRATLVPIRIRQRDADRVIVEAELEPGELVVTEGVQNLRPGAEVRVVGGGESEGAQASIQPVAERQL